MLLTHLTVYHAHLCYSNSLPFPLQLGPLAVKSSLPLLWKPETYLGILSLSHSTSASGHSVYVMASEFGNIFNLINQ